MSGEWVRMMDNHPRESNSNEGIRGNYGVSFLGGPHGFDHHAQVHVRTRSVDGSDRGGRGEFATAGDGGNGARAGGSRKGEDNDIRRSEDEENPVDTTVGMEERLERVRSHFPGALLDIDFLVRLEIALGMHGFHKENSISVLSLCRDEAMGSLARKISSAFGDVFTLNSLGGVLTAGTAGLQAAMDHSPEDDHGRERYVFWAFPHIAIDPQGNVGRMRRPGRKGDSCACGALKAVLDEFKVKAQRRETLRKESPKGEDSNLGRSDLRKGPESPSSREHRRSIDADILEGVVMDIEGMVFHQPQPGRMASEAPIGWDKKPLDASRFEYAFYPPGTHAITNPEYSILQNRLLRHVHEEDVPALDLVELTKVAERVVTEDLEMLVNLTVDPKRSDFAVCTGVVVHCWDEYGRDYTEFVWPSRAYVSKAGSIEKLDLDKITPPTARQMRLLFPDL